MNREAILLIPNFSRSIHKNKKGAINPIEIRKKIERISSIHKAPLATGTSYKKFVILQNIILMCNVHKFIVPLCVLHKLIFTTCVNNAIFPRKNKRDLNVIK